MIELKLNKGYTAIVDDEYYEWLNSFTWHAQIMKNKTIYATTGINRSKMLLHHLILPVKSGFVIDHANKNSLDNTRKNLRYITYSANVFNQKISVRNKSGFPGVFFRKDRNRYVACIQVNGENISLGSYKSFEEAKASRIKAEERYFPGIVINRDSRVIDYENITSNDDIIRKRQKGNKYIGVHYNNNKMRWVAAIGHNGKFNHIGYYESEIEAAMAYINKFESLNGFRPYETEQ